MFYDTAFLRNDEIVLQLEKAAPADPVRNWLPAYHFLICALDGTPMGKIDLRVGHNQGVYYGGNIGYEVFPDYRGHHYAGKACKLLLDLARMHDLGYVYITCNPENIASRKTIEYAGGHLVETVALPPDNDMYLEGERCKCVYKIDL